MSSSDISPVALGKRRRLTRFAFIAVPALAAVAIAAGLWYAPIDWNAAPAEIGSGLVSRGFWTAVAVGLLAQIVDGALGMAYGVTSTTFLLSTGVPPAAASASVHIAEIFTTGFSGLSHWKLGNVNGKLFARLLIPGVIGAVVGAYLVTAIDGDLLKPWISAYLLLLGLYIISKAFRTIHVRTEPPTFVAPLAVTGGFVDAVGGGGWGPVVTTSLLGTGHDPRTTIGSVNAAEFFLAIASGFSFALLGGFTHWTTIAGLVFGGLFAAPFAALLVKKLPTRALLIIVGVLITSLSAWNLWKALA
ncbi:sulfite exporter TauE/SafE family protein [Labrys sp. KNU-23]|uniref:sulfite exporter TauE/SafE family protein n=1 Tax=Labrys sp. KNU-23 TaxID=2789216 RepID=UPI0011ED80D0|nr:sulfite exporter TauE/SafE family protein [Labrys sp. KNU-23]QEN86675.1 sulfite exporter TauE/SafE family protein [Labrys sp. KNU-23]